MLLFSLVSIRINGKKERGIELVKIIFEVVLIKFLNHESEV